VKIYGQRSHIRSAPDTGLHLEGESGDHRRQLNSAGHFYRLAALTAVRIFVLVSPFFRKLNCNYNAGKCGTRRLFAAALV
jgi:hypothetical protein